MKSSFRNNAISGSVNIEGMIDSQILFNEFVNGEGLHFTIDPDKSFEQRFDLHSDQLETIIAIAIYTGFANMELVEELLYTFKKDEEQFNEIVHRFKKM